MFLRLTVSRPSFSNILTLLSVNSGVVEGIKELGHNHLVLYAYMDECKKH